MRHKKNRPTRSCFSKTQPVDSAARFCGSQWPRVEESAYFMFDITMHVGNLREKKITSFQIPAGTATCRCMLSHPIVLHATVRRVKGICDLNTSPFLVKFIYWCGRERKRTALAPLCIRLLYLHYCAACAVCVVGATSLVLLANVFTNRSAQEASGIRFK